jgi:hypothetical protein
MPFVADFFQPVTLHNSVNLTPKGNARKNNGGKA